MHISTHDNEWMLQLKLSIGVDDIDIPVLDLDRITRF